MLPLSQTRTVTDLRALAQDVAAAFHLGEADLTLTEGAARRAGRPVALKRALCNLVENAVRYGTRARIGVGRADTGAGLIAVDDDGPGLPADRMEEAFQPFVRLAASRSSESIGLGLTIARSIVRAHGGTLALSHREAEGLRAESSLPPSRPA